jgi:hypothetical protein
MLSRRRAGEAPAHRRRLPRPSAARHIRYDSLPARLAGAAAVRVARCLTPPCSGAPSQPLTMLGIVPGAR